MIPSACWWEITSFSATFIVPSFSYHIILIITWFSDCKDYKPCISLILTSETSSSQAISSPNTSSQAPGHGFSLSEPLFLPPWAKKGFWQFAVFLTLKLALLAWCTGSFTGNSTSAADGLLVNIEFQFLYRLNIVVSDDNFCLKADITFL